METINAIKQRRAVRDYTETLVERATIERLIAAAILAPSAMNLQPWAFAALLNRERIDNYAKRIKDWLLANFRLLDFQDGRVSFTVKNYAQSGQRSVMHLDAVEFLRRFLLHVLPKGYTRIRHFGICAARNLRTKLEAARRLLAALNASHPLPIPQERSEENRPWWKRFLDRTGIDLLACTHCAAGRLIRRRPIEPVYALPPMGAAAGFLNSS